jgi:hypothetical protein
MDRAIDNLRRGVVSDLHEYEATITSDQDRAAYQKVGPIWDRAEATAVWDALKAALRDESDLNRRNGETFAAYSQQTYGHAMWLVGAILCLSVVIGGALASAVVRQMNQALHRVAVDLTDGAEQVSSASAQISTSAQSLAQGAS